MPNGIVLCGRTSVHMSAVRLTATDFWKTNQKKTWKNYTCASPFRNHTIHFSSFICFSLAFHPFCTCVCRNYYHFCYLYSQTYLPNQKFDGKIQWNHKTAVVSVYLYSFRILFYLLPVQQFYEQWAVKNWNI